MGHRLRFPGPDVRRDLPDVRPVVHGQPAVGGDHPVVRQVRPGGRAGAELPDAVHRDDRRASLGLARTGSISGNGSGDIFIAFSTSNPGAAGPGKNIRVEILPLERMDPLFEATEQATEEAIVNTLVAAETMKGIDD
jgi:hypothetical protein